MLTAYDYSSALHLEKAGIDIALIGDSLGMTVMRHRDTLKVNMNHMIYHSEIVSRTCKNAFIVGDLPFGSFESSPKLAVENSIRLVKEGGVEAVKIEVSYYEWLQNKKNEYWTKNKVHTKLSNKMVKTFDEVYILSKTMNCDLRTASYIHALRRLEKNYLRRGILKRVGSHTL